MRCALGVGRSSGRKGELSATLAVPWALARFAARDDVFAPLCGLAVDGYEIRLGRSAARGPAARAVLHGADGEPIGWQRGNVLGIYLHGLFEDPAVLRAVFGATLRPLDEVFERLADTVDAAFGADALMALLR